MTIDEVIAHTREVAAMNKERAEQIRKLTVYHDIDYAAEHKKEAEYNIQIADWLEELKSIKENSISKEAFEKMKSKAYKKGHRQGYNNAIDDFADKIISLCDDVEFMNRFNDFPATTILEVVEQLKAGGADANNE